MDVPSAASEDQLSKLLSQLLGLELSHVQSEDLEGDSPGTVRKVSVFNNSQPARHFVLKRQEDKAAYCLYTHYLEPFKLNSPKTYGYIDLDGHHYLVMDYINHTPPNWSDGNGYLKAMKWLIKKDLVTIQHLDSVRNLECLGKVDFYGVEHWLPEFEKWTTAAPDNPQAHQIWKIVHANQARIDEYIDELNTVGVQTIVHGDLHLSNMLFGENGLTDDIVVIDWTQPHLGCVTKDLASLYDNAPSDMKDELVKTYRNHIDFAGFEEMFTKARVLRDLGYLSWMAWKINQGQRQEEYQEELDRVAGSLVSALS